MKNPHLVRYADDGSYWLHDLSFDNYLKHEIFDRLDSVATTGLAEGLIPGSWCLVNIDKS